MESSWSAEYAAAVRPNMQMPSTPYRLRPFGCARRSVIIPATLGCQLSDDRCEASASRETLTQTQWACLCAFVLLRRLVDQYSVFSNM